MNMNKRLFILTRDYYAHQTRKMLTRDNKYATQGTMHAYTHASQGTGYVYTHAYTLEIHYRITHSYCES